MNEQNIMPVKAEFSVNDKPLFFVNKSQQMHRMYVLKCICCLHGIQIRVFIQHFIHSFC